MKSLAKKMGKVVAGLVLIAQATGCGINSREGCYSINPHTQMNPYKVAFNPYQAPLTQDFPKGYNFESRGDENSFLSQLHSRVEFDWKTKTVKEIGEIYKDNNEALSLAKEWDVNGDGILSRQEWLEEMKRRAKESGTYSEKRMN